MPIRNRYVHTYAIRDVNGRKRHLWTSPKGLFYKSKTKNGIERHYWVEHNPNYDPRSKGALPYAPPPTSKYY